MEEIAQMVERHFIVEVWTRSPLSFFHFYFWRLNDYGGHYADQVELSAPHHLAGHQQDTEKAVARHRGAVGRGSGELERKRAEIEDPSCSGCRDDQGAADGSSQEG
jgi:hypothetical protein